MDLQIVRPFRIDVFGLQDDFIKTLKPTNFNELGTLTDVKLTLKDDGTQELTFSIPMYYRAREELVENPVWYSTKDGTIIEGLRKVKVIFNEELGPRSTEDGIFEFIINVVNESNKNGVLTCEVKCEGLAFNELGKTGYKLTFNQDEFLAEYEEDSSIAPNINYWMNKVVDGTNWTYSIKMNWDAYYNRQANLIYEDSYASSWQNQGGELVPTSYESAKIKERIVSIDKSNRYNITQEIAKVFGVKCKYNYTYDLNYHIISREIVFYNNLLKEKDGVLDFTYLYNADNIVRTKDTSNLTTKLLVPNIQDNSLIDGEISIADVSANKTGEDYILNFDYLYAIGAIDNVKMNEVKKFEANIHDKNERIKQLIPQLAIYQNGLVEEQANLTFAKNAKIEADEQKNNLTDKINSIFGDDRAGAYSTSNPYHAFVIGSNGSNIVTLRKVGIDLSSVKFAYRQDTGLSEYRVLPSSAQIIRQENATVIKGLDAYANQELYFTFTYSADTYYIELEHIYSQLAEKHITDANNAAAKIEIYQNQINMINSELEILYAEKKVLINNFERLMGAAIREGTWSDDEYVDYGEKHSETFDVFYDTVPFDGEQLLYQEIGTQLEKQYFPYISLSSTYGQALFNVLVENDCVDNFCLCGGNYWEETLEDSSAQEWSLTSAYELGDIVSYLNKTYKCMYSHNEDGRHPKDPASHSVYNVWNIGGQLVYAYSSKEGARQLELVFIKSNTEELLENLQINPHIRKVVSNPESGEITFDKLSLTISNIYNTIIWDDDQRTALYPRFKLPYSNLKTAEDELKVIYQEGSAVTELVKYVDYSVLYRPAEINSPIAAYYITPKMTSYLKATKNLNTQTSNWIIKYSLSNAAQSLYLDALQVSQENAYPKVSYEISVFTKDIERRYPLLIVSEFKPNTNAIITEEYTNLVESLFKHLDRICFINDSELKLDHVRGYISEIVLSLDNPKDDKIVIQNYKTKFEDLFTTIVASTETMKTNEVAYNRAALAFNSDGSLTQNVLQKSFDSSNLAIMMNQGNLTISEEEGIWATSDNGVVAMRGGGIYTASAKDEDGNWLWNTGITPYGINASLITTGQLDTNLIRIYSGDDVAFQLNGSGLYAYRKKIEDDSQKILESEYVVHNGDGLFLVNKAGTHSNADGDDFVLNEDVNLVEISWNGLIVRDYDGNPTFYVDQNTGRLIAKNVNIENAYISSATLGNLVVRSGLNLRLLTTGFFKYSLGADTPNSEWQKYSIEFSEGVKDGQTWYYSFSYDNEVFSNWTQVGFDDDDMVYINFDDLTFNVNYGIINNGEDIIYLKLKCVFENQSEETKESVSIYNLRDTLTSEVSSAQGIIFSSGMINTTLVCHIYFNGVIIEDGLDQYNYTWYQGQNIISEDSQFELDGNTLTIKDKPISLNESITYKCEVSIKGEVS